MIRGLGRYPNVTAVETASVLQLVRIFTESRESLRQRMTRQGPPSLDESLAIAREVAGALHYAGRPGRRRS